LCGEDEAEDDADVGVICDGCDCSFHLQCLEAHGASVPQACLENDADWLCMDCEAQSDDDQELADAAYK